MEEARQPCQEAIDQILLTVVKRRGGKTKKAFSPLSFSLLRTLYHPPGQIQQASIYNSAEYPRFELGLSACSKPWKKVGNRAKKPFTKSF